MRRMIALFLAAFMIALLPAAAAAKVNDEEVAAALEALGSAVDGTPGGGGTLADWEAGLQETLTALDDLEAVAGDSLDTAGFRAALDELRSAIDGGDFDEMAAALITVQEAFAALEAEAGDAAPNGVNAGTAVSSSPNPAWLTIAAILALLAGGALALRRFADRR